VDESRALRRAGWAGAASVVLLVVGVALGYLVGVDDPGMSDADILGRLNDDARQAAAGFAPPVLAAGVALLLWFATGLRQVLDRLSGGDPLAHAIVPAAALFGGLMITACPASGAGAWPPWPSHCGSSAPSSGCYARRDGGAGTGWAGAHRAGSDVGASGGGRAWGVLAGDRSLLPKVSSSAGGFGCQRNIGREVRRAAFDLAADLAVGAAAAAGSGAGTGSHWRSERLPDLRAGRAPVCR
jgi:hypothetical protein